MAFQNTTSIQTVVCPSCNGLGCHECQGFGVYALSGDRTLTFNLAPFLDLKKRKQAKISYLIKRSVLIIFAIILVSIFWSLIG